MPDGRPCVGGAKFSPRQRQKTGAATACVRQDNSQSLRSSRVTLAVRITRQIFGRICARFNVSEQAGCTVGFAGQHVCQARKLYQHVVRPYTATRCCRIPNAACLLGLRRAYRPTRPDPTHHFAKITCRYREKSPHPDPPVRADHALHRKPTSRAPANSENQGTSEEGSAVTRTGPYRSAA